MKKSIMLTMVLLLALSGAFNTHPAAAQTAAVQYQFLELITPTGSDNHPIDINDRNQILVIDENPYPAEHAYIWKNGEFRDLGTVTALDMNKQGQVLIYKADEEGLRRAYLWDNDRLIDLNFVGNSDEELRYVNDLQQVVGHGWPRDDWSPFLLVNGELIDITPDGYDSLPTDLNNRGEVAITTHPYEDEESYIWSDGQLKELKIPSGFYAVNVQGLNDKGYAVGDADKDDNFPDILRAVLWQPDGKVVLLKTWAGYQSMASEINNKGQIVGQLRIPIPNSYEYRYKALVWQSQTAMMELLPVPKGYRNSRALAINYNGYIVGLATNPAGKVHTVLWKPYSTTQ